MYLFCSPLRDFNVFAVRDCALRIFGKCPISHSTQGVLETEYGFHKNLIDCMRVKVSKDCHLSLLRWAGRGY